MGLEGCEGKGRIGELCVCVEKEGGGLGSWVCVCVWRRRREAGEPIVSVEY